MESCIVLDMNKAILDFTYKVTVICRILFTKTPIVIFCRYDGFKAGDIIYYGSNLKATLRKIK